MERKRKSEEANPEHRTGASRGKEKRARSLSTSRKNLKKKVDYLKMRLKKEKMKVSIDDDNFRLEVPWRSGSTACAL